MIFVLIYWELDPPVVSFPSTQQPFLADRRWWPPRFHAIGCEGLSGTHHAFLAEFFPGGLRKVYYILYNIIYHYDQPTSILFF